MDASAIQTLLLGPVGALAIMALGGRWLMGRLEKADDERKARDADFRTLVSDNTRAMQAMEGALHELTGRIENLTNGLSRREVSDPAIRVITGQGERTP